MFACLLRWFYRLAKQCQGGRCGHYAHKLCQANDLVVVVVVRIVHETLLGMIALFLVAGRHGPRHDLEATSTLPFLFAFVLLGPHLPLIKVVVVGWRIVGRRTGRANRRGGNVGKEQFRNGGGGYLVVGVVGNHARVVVGL